MLGTQNTSVLATPNVPLNVQAHGVLFWNMPSSVTSFKYYHSGCCCLCLRVGARRSAVSEGPVCVHPWRMSYIIFSTQNVPWSACKMLSTLWANPMSLWEKARWFRVVTQKGGSGLREGRTYGQERAPYSELSAQRALYLSFCIHGPFCPDHSPAPPPNIFTDHSLTLPNIQHSNAVLSGDLPCPPHREETPPHI